MQIFHDRRSLEAWVAQQKEAQSTIGFVPTMGALHKGHVSLIKKSQSQNDITICSIFVNPTQFDNPEDLEKYPRDIDKDAQLLESVGCDAVFFPRVEDMYPESLSSESFDFNGLDQVMEGRFRKGHFDGVATIVSRFFDIVQPDKAYFGEKDFQQLRIIQELVKLKNYPIQIQPMPIFREESGLAMSSRNARLKPEYLAEAPQIYKLLNLLKDWKLEFTVEECIHKAEEFFLSNDLELEYIMICDEKNLEPISSWDEAEDIRAFIAVYAGDIRLIDNLKIV